MGVLRGAAEAIALREWLGRTQRLTAAGLGPALDPAGVATEAGACR